MPLGTGPGKRGDTIFLLVLGTGGLGPPKGAGSGGLWPYSVCVHKLLQVYLTLRPDSSLAKNTGVGCHALLQGIFLTRGSNHVS